MTKKRTPEQRMPRKPPEEDDEILEWSLRTRRMTIIIRPKLDHVVLITPPNPAITLTMDEFYLGVQMAQEVKMVDKPKSA